MLNRAIGKTHFEDLQDILARLRGRKVAVVGDLILDQFIWGRVDRISPEAPVPVVEVVGESDRLGGAANVAVNLSALGCEVRLVGVIGSDPAGDRLAALAREAGLGTEGLVLDAGRSTTRKSRIIAHQQQVCRFDRENRTPLGEPIRSRLLDGALKAVDGSDAVILSDYAKGVIVSSVVLPVVSRCRESGTFVSADPKSQDLSLYRGVSLITPNKKEAESVYGRPILDEASLRAAAEMVRDCSKAGFVLITRGEEGMSLFDGELVSHFPAVAREVFDVTGAGDTVIATLTLAVAAGATVGQAADLANHAAGIVVGKLGTAAPSVEELLHSLAANDL